MSGAPIDSGVKAYLLEVGLAPILEAFVGECVAQRPTDIFAFMEDFARRQRPSENGAVDSDEDPSLIDGWTVLRAWNECYPTEALQTKLGEQFFSLLFMQQPVMKRTIFAQVGADLSSASQLLGFLFGRRILGDLTLEDMVQFVAAHSDSPIEGYHIQALVSTALVALQSTMSPDVWEKTSSLWREFCMELGSEAEAALIEVRKAESDMKDADATSDNVTVKASWDALSSEDKQRIVTEAFNLLFIQHPTLKRNYFSDVDVGSLVPSLVSLLEKIAHQTVTDEEIAASGVVAKGASLGVQSYQVNYGVTAFLMSLSVVLGASMWGGNLATNWTQVAGNVGRRIEALISEHQGPMNSNDAPQEALPNVEEQEL